MQQKNEERISNKLLTFINSNEMSRWNLHVKRITRSLKKDPSDDYDTDYVDVDSLLNMYLDYFKIDKKEQQKTILKQYQRVNSFDINSDVSYDNVQTIIQNMQSKANF